tara:strand:+ start:596 stop:1006 length:411 start_codon:yes stop_codon:yes gene_type:complete
MSESREAQVARIKTILDKRISANNRRAQADAIWAAGQPRDPARLGKTGRLIQRVPQTTLVRAAIENGGVGILDDKEYWADQRRLHPEIAVEQNISVPTALRNRFGMVKERITFRDGQKITETADGVTVEDLTCRSK